MHLKLRHGSSHAPLKCGELGILREALHLLENVVFFQKLHICSLEFNNWEAVSDHGLYADFQANFL